MTRQGKSVMVMRWLLALAAAVLLTGGAWAKGGRGGGGAPRYVYVPGYSVPLADPGNSCIPDGVSSGQETKTSDGNNALVQGVYGANTSRCPNAAFPNLATTQKLASDDVRNAPSIQCVPPGTQVGAEVTIPFYGHATVLSLQQEENPDCLNNVGASVISTAAQRAAKTAPEAKAAQTPAVVLEPTEAELRQEYERVLAATPPRQQYHVRHIQLRTREDAEAALQEIRSGRPFAEVAAEKSLEAASRARGGDMGWNLPSYFTDEFSKTMVSLAPKGLEAEPTKTRFGWHVIELLETKMGKDWFPDFALARSHIVVRLKSAQNSSPQPATPAKAVCRKMVSAERPATVPAETKGTVVAQLLVENGKVAKVLSLSGPDVFYPAVTAAVNKYECDQLDKAVVATQSFDF